MTQLSVSAGDLRSVLNWSEYKVRRLLSIPFAIQFDLLPSGNRGGNQVRLYDVAFLVPRLRRDANTDENQIAELITIAKKRRYENGKENCHDETN